MDPTVSTDVACQRSKVKVIGKCWGAQGCYTLRCLCFYLSIETLTLKTVTWPWSLTLKIDQPLQMDNIKSYQKKCTQKSGVEHIHRRTDKRRENQAIVTLSPPHVLRQNLNFQICWPNTWSHNVSFQHYTSNTQLSLHLSLVDLCYKHIVLQ